MSLDRVKMETSVSQLVTWMEYLDWEINAFDKTVWYLAQIAAEVRRPYMPKGKTLKVEDFIHKFVNKEETTPEAKYVQYRANRMKQFIFGLVGLSGVSKKKGRTIKKGRKR